MTGESFNGEAWSWRMHYSCRWLDVSRIGEWIVVTIVMELLSYSAGIRLNTKIFTSGPHHLSPYLSARPTLSVVGTCCKANGLKGAIAFLKAAV